MKLGIHCVLKLKKLHFRIQQRKVWWMIPKTLLNEKVRVLKGAMVVEMMLDKRWGVDDIFPMFRGRLKSDEGLYWKIFENVWDDFWGNTGSNLNPDVGVLGGITGLAAFVSLFLM